jgi:hypothetical protein
MVDEPSGMYYGGEVAALAFEKIMQLRCRTCGFLLTEGRGRDPGYLDPVIALVAQPPGVLTSLARPKDGIDWASDWSKICTWTSLLRP